MRDAAAAAAERVRDARGVVDEHVGVALFAQDLDALATTARPAA